ncbi:hypothetical protein B5K06_31910 [Rhizobium grahamii]|uniref:Uncharacterized protein n=1 Tax=Rhizobium grahamii TaxID=1120045 RepID=A0A370KEP2_9HYPH|nr:hypothetical protein B5K06_31910 [Rhizobium grahamii]
MTDRQPEPDALTGNTMMIALIILANKPFYPIYVWLFVGSGFVLSLVTLASLPLFAAVAFLAKRSDIWGRAALPILGTLDTTLISLLFGKGSGTMLFFAPCMMSASLSFRAGETRMQYCIVVLVLVAFACTWRLVGEPRLPGPARKSRPY